MAEFFRRIFVCIQNQPGPLSHRAAVRIGQLVKIKLSQFYRVNLHGSIQFSTTFCVHHLEAMMSLVGIGEQSPCQQADRNGRVQLSIVVPFGKLICIHFTDIVHHSLQQSRMNRDLHFDIENPASRIFGLNIQNDHLSVFEFLIGKRILNRDIRDRSW